MTGKHVWIVAAVALVAVTGLVSPAAVADRASPWIVGAHHELRLIAATNGTAGRRRVSFGLEFRLDPGWKIFWRSPGEAGLPPHADFARSTNVEAATIKWPRPVRFDEYGISSWGYRDHVILPIEVRLKTANAPVSLVADLRYQVCREICILGEARLSRRLSPGAAAPTAAAAAIERSRKLVPTPYAHSKLSRLTVRVATVNDVPALRVEAEGATIDLRAAQAIIEAPPSVRVAPLPSSVRFADGVLHLRHAIRVRSSAERLVGLPVTVTLLGQGFAVERRTRIAAPK